MSTTNNTNETTATTTTTLPLPKWGRTSEERLRRIFLHEVREKCKPQMEAFAKCAHDSGWRVVVDCRTYKNDANDCVKQFSSDETYEAYKTAKKKEWIAQGLLRPDDDA